MNSAKIRLAQVALLTCATFAAANAFAQQKEPEKKPEVDKPASPAVLPAQALGGKSFKKPYGWHLEPILKKISASADQRTKIAAVVQQYRPKIQPLREQYNQKRDEFLKSVCDGKEAEIIMAQQVEMGRLYSDIVSQYTFMRLEIRRHLSPNQIVLLEQYRKQQGWTR